MGLYIILFLFLIIAACMLLSGIVKAVSVFIFQMRIKAGYYQEIPATVKKFERRYWKGIGADLYYYPVYSYFLDGEECLKRCRNYVSREAYAVGQRLTLYQNPKNGKVLEPSLNVKAEIKRSIIKGCAILLITLFVYKYRFFLI